MKKCFSSFAVFVFGAAFCSLAHAADLGITTENFIKSFEQTAQSLGIADQVRPMFVGKMNDTVSYGLGEGSTTLRLRLSADSPKKIEAIFVTSHTPKTEQETAQYVVSHVLVLAAATPNMDGDTRGVLMERLRLTGEAFSGNFESPDQYADKKVFSSRNDGGSLVTTIRAE